MLADKKLELSDMILLSLLSLFVELQADHLSLLSKHWVQMQSNFDSYRMPNSTGAEKALLKLLSLLSTCLS